MSASCCGSDTSQPIPISSRYRRILWIALIANTLMFAVEIVGGWQSNSVSLLADAVDFGGDAANYALSLAVLSLGIFWRARAALVKGASMAAFGVFVLGKSGWALHTGALPEPLIMGSIAVLALAVNVSVAVMLYTYREGDANRRSVWLCSRNDAIANIAVAFAAWGVLRTGSAWPDLIVAVAIAVLALSSGISVIGQALSEIRQKPVEEPLAIS